MPLTRREINLVGAAAWRAWVDETPDHRLETPEGYADLDTRVAEALRNAGGATCDS